MVTEVYAVGNATRTYAVDYGGIIDPASAILSVTTPSIRIPERPWAESPLRAPVPIEVAPPP